MLLAGCTVVARRELQRLDEVRRGEPEAKTLGIALLSDTATHGFTLEAMAPSGNFVLTSVVSGGSLGPSTWPRSRSAATRHVRGQRGLGARLGQASAAALQVGYQRLHILRQAQP
jgi:hypothetical protein